MRPRDPLTPAMMIDWSSQAESMIWLVATADGADTATGHGIIGWHAEPGVARLEVSVLAPWEGHGIGTAVLERLSAWALANDHWLADGSVDESDAGSRAWAGRRGFAEVGREALLRLDLDGLERPEVDPPEGITITSFADCPDTIEGIYGVACEAYPDIPGRELAAVAPFAQWRDNDLAGTSDRPDATFVATAGSEVVGYAKLSFSEALPDTVLHDITGVKRAWRGRGIAGALKRAEIAWAIDSGYAMLKTANEERNAPIRVLNARYGYVAEAGTIRVRGPLNVGT